MAATKRMAAVAVALTTCIMVFHASSTMRAVGMKSTVSTRALNTRCVAPRAEALPSRRAFGHGMIAATGLSLMGRQARAVAPEPICGDSCTSGIDDIPLQTTISGLKYRDIKVGSGDPPPKAFNVVVHYTLMVQTPNGPKEFFSSIDGGRPLDIRIGTGMVIPGLDEGLATMRTGGIRRLYIPGKLSFPKGVKAKPGSPSVPPFSDIIADVQLIYIPGNMYTFTRPG
ncbi:hypothetical protein AAMO2058_000272100 [Amorphochlora amoebiformis]